MRNGPPGGPGFSLVRGAIEGHAGIEIVGSEMRVEHERFFAEVVDRAAPASAGSGAVG